MDAICFLGYAESFFHRNICADLVHLKDFVGRSIGVVICSDS